MELPSQKLIKEVLEKEAIMIQYDEVSSFLIDTLNGSYVVNIYELMHLMKEWAIKLDKQYELVSYIKNSGKGMCEVYETWYNNVEYGDYQYDTVEETEFKAVTKACEWILEQKELK